MKKVMMAVAGLAMAVVLTGCGGSPKRVATKFANAIIQRDTDKAADLTVECALGQPAGEIKKLKDDIEKLGKIIDDSKLEAVPYYEKITVPPEDCGYQVINGAKITEDQASVTVQFVKGKDKKSEGLKVKLIKVNDKWRVSSYSPTDGLDTTSK